MPRIYDIAKAVNKTPVYQIKASMAWNSRNKDKTNEAMKKYYDENKEKILSKQKENYRKKVEAKKALCV